MAKSEKNPLPDPGTTELSNLAWVVSFLRADIRALTLHQLKDVLCNVRNLARLALSDRSRPFAKWEVMPDGTRQSDLGGGRQAFWEARLRETLRDYQTILKKKINELCQHHHAVVHISTGQEFGTFPFEIVTGRPYPALFINEGTLAEVLLAFDFRLLFILQACADRLRICPRKDCAQVFLKTARADQAYCSRRCGSAVRVRRKREKDRKAKQQNMKLTKQKKKGARR